MKFCKVYNLSTGEEKTYSLDPRSAVIAAYAQSKNDYNTWDYKKKYDHLPQETRYGWYLEEWGVRKDEVDA